MCIGSLVTQLSRNALELYCHYVAGYLPMPGGVLEQPAWLMAAFDIIAANRAEDEE